MKKSKILISLILVTMIVFLFLNVSVNAAVSIKSGAGNNVPNNVPSSRVGSVGAGNVSDYGNNTPKYVNRVNNLGAQNTVNGTDLPKAGAADMTGVIALSIVFIGVSVYTYKKVTDYNL